MRSTCRERAGKNPAELLIEEKHTHWLERLGFELFKAHLGLKVIFLEFSYVKA